MTLNGISWMSMLRKLSGFMLSMFLVAGTVYAQRPLNDVRKDFLNLRFGMFIHYSIQTYLNVEHAPPEQDLQVFNPTDLDCRQWADAAKSAKMTYGVLTTKHHDGFSLWDSAYTDYDVGNSAYKGDVLRAYAEAFRSRGLKVGFYYSIRDKQHRIIHGDVTREQRTFIRNQLTELLTNYGKIDCLVFDGWGNAWHDSPSFSDITYGEIYWHIKSLQPECLVITHQHDPALSDIIHFEQNAGQKIPEQNTLAAQSGPCLQSRWFWDRKHPGEELKSVDFVVNQCLKPFNRINCNLLLNCAPNPAGRMDDNVVQRLKEIGAAWDPPSPIESIPESWQNWPVPAKQRQEARQSR